MAGRSYLKIETRTSDVESAISDGYSEIGELADEMESWKYGMEEKLSHTAKYEQVSEAFDTLNYNRAEPNVDAELLTGDTKVSYGETVNKSKKRGISRSDRLGNATSKLSAAVAWLEEAISECEENMEDDSDSKSTEDDMEARKNGLEELRDALQETIDNLDGGVEFPGMYG